MSTKPSSTSRTLDFAITRELEILISAALVFSLLQLPEMFDGWWDRNRIHVGGTSFTLIFILYYVGKLLSYGLIAAFAAHFMLRGLWVALWGLESAFPGGIDFQKLDAGKVQTSIYRKHMLRPEELEPKIDRVASSIFAFVFMFLLQLLMMTMISAVCWMLAVVLAGVVPAWEAGRIFMILLTVYVIAIVGLNLLDKSLKKRPVPRLVEIGLSRLMTLLHYASLNFLYAPIFLTFSTRTSRRKITIIQTSFVYLLIGIFTVTVFTNLGIIRFDDYVYYPPHAPKRSIDARHYDSLSRAGTAPTVPTIESEIARGPWIRLFVPYDADEDSLRIRKLCPELEPLREDTLSFGKPRPDMPDARVDELMSCMSSLYVVRLDGIDLQPEWSLFTDPESDVPGRLTMIDTRSLAPGKHTIEVRHTPLPDGADDEDADEYYIPFWL